MDNGPFRMGNSAAGARGIGSSRAAAPRSEAERPASVAEEPHRKAPTHHSSTPHHPQDTSHKKKFMIAAGIVVVIISIILVGWIAFSSSNRTQTGATVIDNSKYQAVFFTNGQVYFGKLQPVDTDYMKLTGVFYLQNNSTETENTKNPQKTADNSSGDVQLVKLGNEIHGPTDEMIVSKDQVLFFENLKGDGKVASSIDQYNKSHK